MNIDYELIGSKIKKARENMNLTQEKLAEQLFVSSAYVSKIERGKTTLNLNTLDDICCILNISMAYLLTGVSYKSDDYMKSELNELLKKCPPERLKLVTNIIKQIIEYKE